MKGLILLMLCVLAAPLGAAEIAFRERARTGGEWVKIRDVATVTASKEEEEILAEAFLGAAPSAGSSRHLDEEYLRRRLGQFGLTAPLHKIFIPVGGVVVEAADTRDRRSEVEVELETLLAARLKGVSRVSVSLEDPQGLLTDLPKGLLSVEILSDKFLPEASARSPLHLRVSCSEESVTGRFMAQIRIFRMELGSLRRLGTRVDIKESEVGLREWEVIPGDARGFSDPLDVAGCKASRLIQEGTRLIASDVLPKTLVRKGDISMLEGGIEGLRVSLSAKALVEGREGEIILFEAPGGQRLKARIVSKQKSVIVGQADVESPKVIHIGGGS